MKTQFLTIVFLLIALGVFSQAPQSFKFQTIVRDANGQPLSLQDLSIKFLIRVNVPDGIIVYEEQHQVTTSSFGLVDINIGEGQVLNGSFNEINWGNASYFLEEQIDIGNTNNFQVFGTIQLLSVPYSLYSNKSGNGIRSMNTGERDEIENPYLGMQIYNTDTKCLNYYTGDNWFETCGQCTPQPTEASAGDDQIGLEQNWVVLQGNQPIVGDGHWSIIYGVGGQIEDVNNPNSIFYGQPNTQYILQWQIETVCRTSIDQVTLEFGVYEFACGDTLLDERDQQKYGTVVIGTQCWMSENLNIGVMIPVAQSMTNNGIVEKYCHSNQIDSCFEWGALYQWNEVMQYSTTPGIKGICPEGWHIPTHDEFQTLVNYLGGNINAGIKMKEIGNRHWWYRPSGTNESGFNAFASGIRYDSGFFSDIGWNGFWWSSSKIDLFNAYFISLGSHDDKVHDNNDCWGYNSNFGSSIRCVLDN